MIQTIFTVLICLQFVVIALHDLVHIPGWTHGRQVRAALGPTKMVIGTLVNCILPGIAAVFAIRCWRQPPSPAALYYWIIYCGITLFGATTSWWIPYFFGANEKTKQLYAQMYAGTYQVLPPRGDNPRPNLLHLFFHALLLTTVVLSVLLWFGVA